MRWVSLSDQGTGEGEGGGDYSPVSVTRLGMWQLETTQQPHTTYLAKRVIE